MEVQDLTEQQRREVRMYGCTAEQIREDVEQSITFKFSGAAMLVAGMLSDAQEMVGYHFSANDSDRLANILEEQRQLLNRAKFIMFEYMMKERV